MIVIPTVEQLADLAAQGPFWWYRLRSQTYYATADNEPEQPDDVFFLEASPQWIEQWNGDWQAALDQLSPLIEKANTATSDQ